MLENLFIEGETYHVRNFIVRQYGAMHTERCFRNDVYIQLYNMTEIFATGVVEHIPHHVFQFTELSAIINAALEANYLIGDFSWKLQAFVHKITCIQHAKHPISLLCYTDVVGVMEKVHPILTYTNKYNQQKSSIKFTINDITSVFSCLIFTFSKN